MGSQTKKQSKATLKKLKQVVESTRRRVQRDDLMPSTSSSLENQTRKQIMATEAESTNILRQARAQLVEAEESAVDTMERLGDQRRTMERTQDNMTEQRTVLNQTENTLWHIEHPYLSY